MVGVAPHALVMPLRVFDDNGSGNSADVVAAAFAYAGERGLRVVNASLGSPYPSLVERRALEQHPPTLFVVAAGNGGPDGIGDDNDDDTREYPCAHDVPNLVCVGAIDARAAFSNDGTASVDLCAQPAARKAATVRRVRVAGRPRVCRRCGCQARTATLSFVLSAEAGVIARLQRHRCVRTRCRCPARERTRHLAAGTTRWTVGQQLLGMPLRRGTRRLTLATSDSTARREVPRPLADAWRPI